MKLALTGMIGSGKTTAMMELRRLGWLAISTDALAKEVTQSAEAGEFLKKYFGGSAPQKAELREKFVRDGDFRKAWEEFLHPRINAAWRAFLAANQRGNCVVELPLLFEKGLEKHFEKVVICQCSPAVAIARWVKAGRSAEDYEALSKLLLPLQEKVSRADFVLTNDTSAGDFLQAVRALHAKLLNS